jgi:TonB family protein
VVAQLVDVEDLQNEMSGTGESKTEGAGGGGGGGGQNYGPSGEGPGVLSTGLLGLLTTEGFSGGPSVVDILGGSGGVGDIDAILGGLGGLTTSGAGGGLGGGGLGGLGGLGGSGGMDLAALLGGGGGGGFDSSELETAGTVTLTGPSSISGTGAGESGRTSSAISSVISAHMAGLQSAYNAQLKRNPNLGGKIVVTFTVNAQGIVTNAYVSSSTMNSPELESQVVSRIYGWKFPAVSGGEVTVVYPFVFIKI